MRPSHTVSTRGRLPGPGGQGEFPGQGDGRLGVAELLFGGWGASFGDRQSRPLFRIVNVINTTEKMSSKVVKMANFVTCISPRFFLTY